MSTLRVTLDLDPTGTTVRGLVGGGPGETIDFSSWLELMQALERLLVEAEPTTAEPLEAGGSR